MSTIKRVLLWLMAAFYIFGGLMHFARADYYMPMMPPYLPWHGALIFLSGVAELGLGIAVLILDLDIAWPESGSPRVHFGFGITF